jgi:Mn2+/Fe2+ NRAMP family transporter
MNDAADPYTQRPGETADAPHGFFNRLKHLGPGVIVSGSIVGSGEILLTSSLGAQAGFVLLWWVLLACWSKSIVQAELARYIITSGDTYLRALNRLPGRIATPRGAISWPIALGLLAFIPGITGLAGIIGGAGQALALLFGSENSVLMTAIIALSVTAILWTGAYLRIERAMLFLVISFTLTTLVCAFMMQATEYRMTLDNLTAGFTFDFPVEYAVLALAMYGYTGVNSGEISAYMYWCVEKGYPNYIGADRSDPRWPQRANGWLKVLRTDVWVTLLILTCATLPFYLLGAGVLHRDGLTPQGLETISVLSDMFTRTLGAWSLWVFGLGAFFILFSTALSGIGAGGRFIPEYLIEMGYLDRQNVKRELWIRGYVLVIPPLSFVLYLFYQSPLALVTFAAVVGAMLLPIQSGVTLWLHHKHLDPRVQPGLPARLLLVTVFIFQCAMAAAVIRFVVF